MGPRAIREQQSAAAAWRLPRGVVLAGLLAFAIMTTVMVDRFGRDYLLKGDYTESYKDAGVWYDAGRRVLEGRPLARIKDYRYPPSFAVLIAPLCALPSPVFYFVWYLLSVALFAAAVRLAVRLAWISGQPPPAHLLWVPALVVAVYAADNWLLGQTNALMTALLYWVLVEVGRGREVRAGAVLGASVAIKVFTLPLIGYLLYRRRWVAATTSLLSLIVFLFLLPVPVRGFQRNTREVKEWADRVVEPYLTEGEAGDWGQHALDYGDQSLQAVLNRLLTPVNAAVVMRDARPFSVNIASLSRRQVNVILLGVVALFAAIFIAACGWAKPFPAMYPIEAALATIFLLLVSGLAWTYFFIALLLPAAVVLALLSRHPELPPRTRRALAGALWLQGAAVVSLVSPYARALGSVCWAAVALYVALAAACRQLRRLSGTAGTGRGVFAFRAIRPGHRPLHSGQGGTTMPVDPVCGMEVSEENAAAKEEYQGTTYYFCSDYCRDEFMQDPEAYVGGMSEDEEAA